MSDAPAKAERLLQELRRLPSALVAFSGGVDSSLLLAVAREALGDRAVAVIARSPSLPAREHDAALSLARQLGARCLTVETNELADPKYRKNPPDRCYHCKQILFRTLAELAQRQGLAVVIEGSNTDDEGDYRPGRRALGELGILSPLAEAGLGKAEIRELARARGLPVWDKPSMACLASRVPYGAEITAERLQRIDRAEEALRALGFRQVRVRDHDEVARIEPDPAELERLLDAGLRARVVAALKTAGYRYVALDLEGYRSGSMNEVLTRDAREGG